MSSSAGVSKSDDGLLLALAQGDSDAVARLYERHQRLHRARVRLGRLLATGDVSITQKEGG